MLSNADANAILMLPLLKYSLKSLKRRAFGKEREKQGKMDTERQKFCFLAVPRAAVAYGRQLKILPDL